MVLQLHSFDINVSPVRFLSRRRGWRGVLLVHLRFTRNDGVFATFIKAVFTNVPLGKSFCSAPRW